MPKARNAPPTAPEALYDKLIATIPEIERKGDANPYTSLNGNMFTLLHQSRLAIRLPEDEREKFLKKYKTSLFEAYGTVMNEYVAVPQPLTQDERTEEVPRAKLFVRQNTKTETNEKEQVIHKGKEAIFLREPSCPFWLQVWIPYPP